ncbi:MAG: cyanophycin synthetase [Patescibacteria group bacterium]|jgi:UDP-N-acetylmuramoyl-tripeptide--D-alanyl-D-alanine ligase
MKSQAYFWLARYFRFFAKLVLLRWHPKVIVITGSAGKTTALQLTYQLVVQKYPVKKSYKANSAIGVPLDVLGLHFTNYSLKEWFINIVKTPVRALKRLVYPYVERYYLVELDVDRPNEMEFFSQFITPHIIFWVSSYATHTQNFEPLVKQGLYPSVQEAVTGEYAKIQKAAKKKTLLITNGDSKLMTKATNKYPYKKISIRESKGTYQFTDWTIFRKRTEFTVKLGKRTEVVTVPHMVPKNFGYTLVELFLVAEALGIDERMIKVALENYSPLPGRSSVFKGVNDSMLIDSTYNSSYYASSGLLTMLQNFPGRRKIAVLGDMRELGKETKSEHRRLAQRVVECAVDQVVLVGPQTKAYVLPYLLDHGYSDSTVHHFDNSYQAGLFIKERLSKSGDVILLKASQNTLMFEIIVEMLLADKSDVEKLCRRELIWEKKRQLIKKSFYDSLNS